MKGIKIILSFLLVASLFSCQSKDQIKKVLKENPDILTDAIKENPVAFVEAFQEAVKNAQQEMAKKREEEEKKKFLETINKPLVSPVRKGELVRGTEGAPITLIEWSDFECPYCTRGFETVLAIMDKYKGKVQFVYRHLPLERIHPNAKLASKYYEAIGLQSKEKAFKFHDELFKNQTKIRKGDSYLKSVASKLGLDMGKLAKDLKSEAIEKKIQTDMEEASKFGMQGTPGFLINGIPLRGAYPLNKFVEIVELLKEKGKLKL